LTIKNLGRIIPGTPAERCGRLRAGDCVVMINGEKLHHFLFNYFSGFSTGHMAHRQVIDYIKSCGNQVTFTIDPSIPFPRYAAPNGTTISGPIEAEDAVYATSNQYGTLNGINQNGNVAIGTGLDYLNQDDKVCVYKYVLKFAFQDYKLLTVELSRGVKNFGFSIRGGFEFGRMPLFILRIADDGPAAEEGTLRVGDQLVEINGESTVGMTHERGKFEFFNQITLF
jgi:hypothetical protein